MTNKSLPLDEVEPENDSEASSKTKLLDSQEQVTKHARKFLLRRWDKLRHVRLEVIYWGLMMAVLFIVTGLQINYSRKNYLKLAPQPEGTYSTSIVGQIDNLNPFYANTYPEQAISQLVFSQLFDYDSYGKLRGDLVKSIVANNKGKNYVLTLREDASWHDGQPVTAKDVIYTLRLLKSDATSMGDSRVWRSIDVKQIGDYSLEFNLPSTYAPFPHALTFSILPEHILKDVDLTTLSTSNFSQQSPIGSGPFKFVSLQSSDADSKNPYQVVNLARNDQYYRPVKLSRFEIHAFKDQAGAIEDLASSNVNAAANIAKSQLANQSNLIHNAIPTYGGGYLFFNTTQSDLKSADLRRGLGLVLDVEQIREQVNTLDGYHLPLDQPVLARQLSGVKLPVRKATPDLEAAKKSLTKAGYNLKNGQWLNKNNQQLTLKLAILAEARYEKIAELVKAAWEEFGVKIDLKKVTTEDANVSFIRDVLQPRDYDVLIYEIQIGGDPDVFAFWHSTQASQNGLNFSNYSNVLVDDALVTARSTTDMTIRSQKYLTITKQWLEDVPAIGLYQTTFDYAIRRDVRSTNLYPNTAMVSQNNRFANVYEWSVNQATVYKTP